MINSVLLPNESNQPLVDKPFYQKNISDLFSLAEFILVLILTLNSHRYLALAEESLHV